MNAVVYQNLDIAQAAEAVSRIMDNPVKEN